MVYGGNRLEEIIISPISSAGCISVDDIYKLHVSPDCTLRTAYNSHHNVYLKTNSSQRNTKFPVSLPIISTLHPPCGKSYWGYFFPKRLIYRMNSDKRSNSFQKNIYRTYYIQVISISLIEIDITYLRIEIIYLTGK